MNIMIRVYKYLSALFSSYIKRKKLKTIIVDDIPEKCKKGIIYIVGEDNPWYAVMACPCGCNEIIRLCLQDEVSPSWKLKWHKKDKSVSLTPSVWRINGCRSHFFLRQGLIDWCK